MITSIQNNENTTKLLNLLKKSEHQYPCLSKDEERALIEKYKNDRETLNKLLFMHNIKAVFNQAKAFVMKTKDFDNLVQDGMLGLGEACKRFDPDKGVKFITYAMPWIRKFILANFYGKQPELEKRSVAFSTLVSDLAENANGGHDAAFDNVINECIDPTYAVPNIDEQLSVNEKEEIYKDLINQVESDNSLSVMDKSIFIDVVCNKEKASDLALKYQISKTYISELKNRVLGKLREFLAKEYNISDYSMI